MEGNAQFSQISLLNQDVMCNCMEMRFSSHIMKCFTVISHCRWTEPAGEGDALVLLCIRWHSFCDGGFYNIYTLAHTKESISLNSL